MFATIERERRLAAYKEILENIAVRRERERDPGVGASIERQILSQELSYLEYAFTADAAAASR